MKKFLIRVILFGLLQSAGLLVFWGNNLPGENNYLARTIEKQERLESTTSPRLILVGGSNVAFGFVSEELRQGLGLPIVNMGLVAGLGLEFMLNEVRDSIRPGDIVLLSPEYDFGAGGRDLEIIKQLLELRPASARFVSRRDWGDGIADSAFNWMGRFLRRAILKREMSRQVDEGAYRRDGFDEANCYVAHYGRPSPILTNAVHGPITVRTVVHPLEPRALKMVTDFAAHCAERGAICVYSSPPQPLSILDTDLKATQELVQKLKLVPHLEVLDAPEEQLYPIDYFYDTQYHLTEEGARVRTKLVVDRLKGVLQRRKGR